MNYKKKAFTLIELLVSIAIVGVLATISIATFEGYFEKARLAKAQANAKQVQNLFLSQNASTESDLFTAWYGFDRDGDINSARPYVIDKSPAGNNLTGRNGTSYSQSTETPNGTGESIRIDETYLIGSPNISSAINKFTIAFWIKLDKDSVGAYTNTAWISSATGFTVYPNGTLRFYMTGAGLNVGNAFTFDQWHYVVGSFDGDTMKIWLDGDLIGTKTGVTMPANHFDGKSLVIGRNSVEKGFHGWLDEVMFFPYAFGGEKLE